MTDSSKPLPSTNDPEFEKMLEGMRKARQRDHDALVANTLPSADDGGPWRLEPHGILDISKPGSLQVTITAPVTEAPRYADPPEDMCDPDGYDDLYQPDWQTGPDPRQPEDAPPPPDLDPEQARRKRLSADLLDAILDDERRFEEREYLEACAEDFERSLGDHDD